MKYIIILTLLLSTLYAEVTTLIPTSVIVNYNKNSFKDSGTMQSVYLSTGTLSYLTEFNYVFTDIRYKYNTNNLVQHEYTIKYSRYFPTFSYNLGIHTNTTTDTDLQNGTTFILGTNKWKYFGYKKLSYGIDIYHSYYTDGKDLHDNNRTINISQITPSLSYYKPFKSFANFIAIKFNYEIASTYNKSFFSYEIQDIIYYKKLILTLNYFGGEMQTGITDNGFNVYNSKDILKQKIKIKVGYKINEKIQWNLALSNSVLDEFKNKNNILNNVISLSLNYKVE